MFNLIKKVIRNNLNTTKELFSNLNYIIFENKKYKDSVLQFSEPPIFIIGVFRSGTSLLRRIFDSHPHIVCPPETKFMLALFSILKDPVYMKALQSMGFSKYEIRDKIAEFINYFHCKYAVKRGKKRWADKTPDYVDYLEEIKFIFKKQVFFVFIVRDALDVCFSMEEWDFIRSHSMQRFIKERFNGSLIDPLKVYATYWAEKNKIILKFLEKNPEKSILIKYEDLCVHPEDTLKKVFKKVGAIWDPIVLKFYSIKHDKGIEDYKIEKLKKIELQKGKYLKKWDIKKINMVKELTDPIRNILGYV